jgi:acyl-coenzyme A synthetase/AMP-(fatty) acid ligase
VELSGRKLLVLGRSDSVIKILGEKVEMDFLQARIESIAGKNVAVIAIPEGRKGNQLVLLTEQGGDVASIISQYNLLSTGPERIVGFGHVSKIPRGPLGKLNRNALQKILDSHGDESFQLI